MARHSASRAIVLGNSMLLDNAGMAGSQYAIEHGRARTFEHGQTRINKISR
jgi:hypothetical protein